MTLDLSRLRAYTSHGDGRDFHGHLGACGLDTVIEDGVRIFHPAQVRLGQGVYLGHGCHLDGYHSGHLVIGDGSWIGAGSFLHGAAGLDIGRAVGIGPRVTILTSQHRLDDPSRPVLHAPLVLGPVVIGDGADLGAGAVILPGVTVGEGAVVGAGSVVTSDVPAGAIVAGNPARLRRQR